MDEIENTRKRLRAFLPIAFASLISVAIFSAVVVVAPPNGAGDWGSLLSAAVALVALGAFTTTIFLQREELALQRKEIANLAVSARDQGDSLRRQTTIESYRVIDEKIEALFNDEEFLHMLNAAKNTSYLKHMIAEVKDTPNLTGTADLRGIQNIRDYKFITQFHKFPISIHRDVSNLGESHQLDCLLPIMQFCILQLVGSGGVCGHVYELAKSLDLLDYTRHVIGRRTIIEAPIFALNYFERMKLEPFRRPFYLAPGESLVDWEDTVRYHLENELMFYNPLTASLAQVPIDGDVFSPWAEEPFQRPQSELR